MLSNLEDYVVKITSADAKNLSFGTGFVFADREGKSYVLTCAHVMRDVGGSDSALVDERPARIIVCGGLDDADLAVVEVAGDLGRPILRLRANGETGARIRTAGYQKFENQLMVRPLAGELGNRLHVAPRKGLGGFAAWDLRVDGDFVLQPGYSGSPLLDAGSNFVLGVVSHRHDQGRKGVAISVAALIGLWPDRPSGILEPIPLQAEISDSPNGPPLMNFEKELAAFQDIASGEDNATRLILVHGPSGTGKTRLLDEYRRVATHHGLDVLTIPLEQQLTVEECLSRFVYRLGPDTFPHFEEQLNANQSHPLTRDAERNRQRSLTFKFFLDLRQSRTAARLAMFFDPYEKADRDLKSWLSRDFVPAVCSSSQLIAVVAGQDTVDPKPTDPEHRHFPLEGVTVDWYFRYAEDLNMSLDPLIIKEIHAVLHGRPKEFVEYLQAMRAQGISQ